MEKVRSDQSSTLLQLDPKQSLNATEIEPFSENNDSSTDEDDDDEWDNELEEDDGDVGKKNHRKKKKKFNWRLLVELVLFFIIMTGLIGSLSIKSIKNKRRWGLEIWKWCVMVMVTFCGRLVSAWVMGFAVFLIERNFMLREKVLYFVYGLRKSIQNCIWLGLVLLAWTCMFNGKVQKKNKILQNVFRALVAVLLGATIWLIKIILVKVLASSFHVTTYFDRMKESVFHHYILETLSGPPMDEFVTEEKQNHDLRGSNSLPANWNEGKSKEARNNLKLKKFGSRKIDMEKLKKLSMERTASAWSVKRLASYITSSGLSTISKTVDDFGKSESEITSEWEARSCAQKIFKNVANAGAKYIEEEDLMRFLKRVEIHTIFPLFEGAIESGRITKASFRNWVVRAYFERKALAHSLNDTKTAVQQLHKLASAVVIVIIIVVSLLVMKVATTQVIFFFLTQLVLVGFMFQNTCKMIFESIIFIFVMHPFDIGDRCVIDGVQMIVEEMNILTTVFLRYDMEKIYYPNAVLLTKPISNFYRSPEMGDAINFTIDISTSMETIIALKRAIQLYVESKPKYWNPKHSVIVKEIDVMNKLKMCVHVQHTINHQNYGERSNRISEFILELKKIFENLGIEYHLLPQEIHLTQLNLDNSSIPLH
ncbi:Mechanosensitive ion channel protein [Melia azedarach]|uniref:Mechanosensitive ion channel protein n=1 Tax=Melia azedarach TaxID=155640 RepID=A0ACC1YY77_MELAZ|nr:Mechanosensitive ion channel protein [Melia azedarach]